MVTASAKQKFVNANNTACVPHASVSLFGFIIIFYYNNIILYSPLQGVNSSDDQGDCFPVYEFSDDLIIAAHVYNFFMLLWMLFFVIGLGEFNIW